MATVYLADDVRHGRRVAIKVLHPELSAVIGADRFLAEIKTTAALQHPHILPLFDSGNADGLLYYVMPFVEGETLRARLDREKQLPVADAVRIASDVASALDYAHRRGIIHRDIKPENILLHEGQALVADFGIALAVQSAAAQRMTQTGLSLGTPQYMSPEQAMGEREITARSDVYSLGAVTYEMLVGEPPFTGATVQAIVARIVTERPKRVSVLRDTVPAHIEAAIDRSLAKVPADRFDSAAQLKDALGNTGFTWSYTRAAAAHPATEVNRWRTAAGVAGVIAVASLGTAVFFANRPTASRSVLRHIMSDSTMPMTASGAVDNFALSPDGLRIASARGGTEPIIIRRRDDLSAQRVPGTEGATDVVFSPDGRQVAFSSITGASELRIVNLDGGTSVIVSESISANYAWGSDGYLYGVGRGSSGIVRARATARAPLERVTVADTATEQSLAYPEPLPGGRSLVYTATRRGGGSDIVASDVGGARRRVLVRDAIEARYSRSGHLVWMDRQGTIMAARFDVGSLTLDGDPVPLGRSERGDNCCLAQHFEVSASGTLAYASGGTRSVYELRWVRRDGTSEAIDTSLHPQFTGNALSRDGKRVAFVNSSSRDSDIFIKELGGSSAIRLTNGGRNAYPTWTRNDDSVTYVTNVGGNGQLWTRRADGSGQAAAPFQWNANVRNAVWARDGTLLITARAGSSIDIYAFTPGRDTTPRPIIANPNADTEPTLSPDGKYIAYLANLTGQQELYVSPYPNTSASRWMVSSAGAYEPVWSPAGNEIFYGDLKSRRMVAARVRTSPSFAVLATTTLFQKSTAAYSVRYWDVSRDGTKFLMPVSVRESQPEHIVFVENVFDELRAKLRK